MFSQNEIIENKNLIVTNPSIFPYGININLSADQNPKWAREFNFSFNGQGNIFSFGCLANGSSLEYGYIGGNRIDNKSNYTTPWMTFLPNGYVGIGISKPTTLLDVNGGIKEKQLDVNGTVRSKEVKIEATGWSDFVFDKDYKLPTLSEVENHIMEYKHLPDIPSEKQVIEEGINVVEMQAKLLQKIEELTLYVIGQNKQIESLHEKNNKQEKLIEELRLKLKN